MKKSKIVSPCVILAIESAIGQGSIALVSGSRILAESRGEASRSETLSVEIEKLADKLPAGLDSIGRIAVSSGPGSFTGLRIGIATALGLARALDVPVSGIALLEAIASQTALETDFMVATSLGRSDVCFQYFSPGGIPAGPPQALSFVEFTKFTAGRKNPLIAESSLFGRISGETEAFGQLELLRAPENLAAVIAFQSEISSDREGKIEPIYVQSPRAISVF
ncbi:MAG: tRNA (adenosine(37)-N6)-threonylcarbamoyltransferase complex dimerization subunit type 1 TsaB [Pyrinomonadaceae bacterium]|jgi:tRNA threonylcarbamoyl adenosine modification protein YeaZ